MAKWIDFIESPLATGKTKRYVISPKDGGLNLGIIKWFSHWRKYSFFPFEKTIWEERCLQDVTDFCKELNAAHKAALILKKAEQT